MVNALGLNVSILEDILSLLFANLSTFLDNKKSPKTEVPEEIVISVMIAVKDYSMIVATLPDPTVRPPSRYQTGVLWCANSDFSFDL